MPRRRPCTASYNAMISGYLRNGKFYLARDLFEKMPQRNLFHGMLSFVQNGRIEGPCQLFKSKPEWDLISWNCLMGGYVKKMMLGDARQLFVPMPVITGYTQNGDMSEAKQKDCLRSLQFGMCSHGLQWYLPEISYNAMVIGFGGF
ncbi:pentatricopeptide repeat-containing protein [Senna tora]|uniref:Pentatricopeptide repeat-containing protein n=1 Tax=Senna tora TaxID=362788 RepID=A0A834TD55_9FABA|nr:pentatricopeptide repeat-containing protein [Senna tora]